MPPDALRIALAAIGAMPTVACATTQVTNDGRNDFAVAGEVRPAYAPHDARPTFVEGATSGVSVVVVVRDRAACVLPCTVWAGPSDDVRVDVSAPTTDRITLPHGDGITRVVVDPKRGHPGGGVALAIAGGIMSLIFVPAAISASPDKKTDPNAPFQLQIAPMMCGPFTVLAVIGVAMLGSGILLGLLSDRPSVVTRTGDWSEK